MDTINKWEELKLLIDASLSHNVHYSLDRQYEQASLLRVKKWMEMLDRRQREQRLERLSAILNSEHSETLKKLEDEPKDKFLFTDLPTFDRKAWEHIMEEKGLQGLA